jgi:hypothetical protein
MQIQIERCGNDKRGETSIPALKIEFNSCLKITKKYAEARVNTANFFCIMPKLFGSNNIICELCFGGGKLCASLRYFALFLRLKINCQLELNNKKIRIDSFQNVIAHYKKSAQIVRKIKCILYS